VWPEEGLNPIGNWKGAKNTSVVGPPNVPPFDSCKAAGKVDMSDSFLGVMTQGAACIILDGSWRKFKYV
jgi:hypothetical protein